jgi:hypothetical protein
MFTHSIHDGAPAYRLALALALLVPGAVWGAVDTGAETANLVLARYTGRLGSASESIERGAATLDIEASLPKLAKQGRLQAIRRLVPLGKPVYEVVRTEGDRTVRQQVIARYLSAEAEAQSVPSSSFAINNANYKFHYLGSIGAAQNLAYVFKITPRKKRRGLIRGEVWIDAATGVAVHQSGYLVKKPSVFLRRVSVVQDTDLRGGRPYLRITHLDVDTLLVGRAELTITERPGEPVAAVR